MEFARLVKSHREKTYSSARVFYKKARLSCSYFYYSKIESGTLPKLVLAIEVLKALKANVKSGLMAWMRDQLPDAETRSYFADLPQDATRSTEQRSHERSLVVNRMQASLLKRDPVYWEIMIFLSCHYGMREVSIRDLHAAFRMTAKDLRDHLKELHEFGLIDCDEKAQTYRTKEWLFIPFDDEFRGLRELNLKKAFSQYQKSDDPEKGQTTITRFLDPDQVRDLQARTLALVHYAIDLKENPGDGKSVIHTFGFFRSRRRFGE